MNEKDYLKDLIELETEKTRLGSIYYILNKFTKEFISEYIKGLEKDYNNTCKEIEIKRKNEKKKVNNKESSNKKKINIYWNNFISCIYYRNYYYSSNKKGK